MDEKHRLLAKYAGNVSVDIVKYAVTDSDGLRVFAPETKSRVGIIDRPTADGAVGEIMRVIQDKGLERFEIRFDMGRMAGIVKLFNNDEELDIVLPNEAAMYQLTGALYARKLKQDFGVGVKPAPPKAIE